MVKFVVGYIKKRIKRNKNLLAMFEGDTGSGKSWAALSLAEELDDNFDIDRVVFNGYDFLKLVNQEKLKPGSVIVYDEAGVGAGHMEFQQKDTISFNYVLQTFREWNYIVLFTAPQGEMIVKTARELTHMRFDMYEIDESNDCSYGYVYNKAKNRKTGKTYWKNPQMFDGTYIRAKRFDKPSKKLLVAYKKKKEDYMRMVVERALTITAERSGYAELTDLQEKVYDMYERQGMTQQEVADSLGVSRIAIVNHLKGCRKKGFKTSQKTKVFGKIVTNSNDTKKHITLNDVRGDV